MSTFFHIYIGAVYIRHGLGIIQTWISALINPDMDIKLPASTAKPEPQIQPQAHHPPSFGQQLGYLSPSTSSQTSNDGYAPSAIGSPMMNSQYSMYPPPPSLPPPPLPNNPPVSSSLSLVTLALVNQTATQKGYQVSYPAEQIGPAHQPTWTVRCCCKYCP